MSTADGATIVSGREGTDPRRGSARALRWGAGTALRADLRLFGSEFGLHLVRRRNWAGVGVLLSVPIILAVCVKVTSDGNTDGAGPGFLTAVTDNGLFVALAALTMELPLFLPLAMATICADTVAGEANTGTLRYLLVVPVHRTRLLIIKYLAVLVAFTGALLLLVVVGWAIGTALFGGGSLTTLSGEQISFWAGVGRLLLVCLYIDVCFAGLAAIGMFVSTLTEQPLAVVIATVAVATISQVLDTVPQLSSIHGYLPTHHWMAFADLFREPVALGSIRPGILSALAYAAIFLSAAWARFGDKDITC
ncbi:MAG: type transport system permease protein [Actinomycetota bacterium]|nr:type transport system permease protein [Actinomycetota bacterium]